MDGSEADDYAELPARITELGARLQLQADETMAHELSNLMAMVDAFHRNGLTRLVEMIEQWRGEIFLESAARDPLAGVLLSAYDLPIGS